MYLDKIVLFAYRAGRVSVDDLPALPEDQKASSIKHNLLPVSKHSQGYETHTYEYNISISILSSCGGNDTFCGEC